MLKYFSRKQLGWTMFIACGLGLLLFYLTTFALASPPESKYGKTLNLNDKLVIKSSACNLQIPTQTDTKMIVRCVASSNAEKISRTTTKTVIQLAATDRLKVNANGCRLQVMTNTVSRVVIKCVALPSQTNTPTTTATATLTPTPTSTTTTNWLARVNYYRDMANLPHVSENATWSNGDYLHSRYMVKNDFIGHTEDTNNPWFTAAGKAAAENSDLMVSSSVNMSDVSAIDGWMGAPFHAVGIIDPALNQVGYGSYREADGGWQTGAGLDVIRGLGSIPGTVMFPVKFPSNDKTVALTSYTGNEYPNPLTSCAGYAAPTGLPLILQIGSGSVTPNVTAHSFKQGATSLAHCIFDETNYTNPNSSEQSLVRSVLNARDAIVLIPRAPLESGKTYTVSITTNGNTYTWGFSVANSAAPAPSEFAREIR